MQEVPEIIHQLVKKFEEHKSTYLSPSYNEENLRIEFLNPFFEALGWDVKNELNQEYAYRDVVHEEFLRGDWGGEAPDYTFRIGKEKKFFVEAKKPSENLQTNKKHVYQLRRYGWSSSLPISILTDFEELVVYETTTRPQESAAPSNSRVLYIQYDQYLERWDEIYNLFSREAVINGSLEQFAKEKNLRRGKNTVDEEFLKEIERWRSLLADNLAKQNRQLTISELNFAVQKIIDRIIFLRVCEDRGLERYGELQGLQNGNNIYERLIELFYRADEKYNSGLFHFSSKKDDSESADTFTTTLKISDEVLKEIFNNLYYPTSPFVFEALPQEILGQVYEQFLGKVISLNDEHEATVEEKPEVKKAGGVYYTPSYIVDYIVKETVGKLVEGKTPKQVEKLTIVDPACGSGSFLLGAYTFLLDWYRDWYVKNDPQKYARGAKPVIYQTGKDDWQLTIAEKKRILLNNIYGVDIDYQAVEVTKLTLLLKLLEGEKQLHFADTGILPSLGKNIKCGNSLIGSDFYHQEQETLFDLNERKRINAFDWENEFKEVINAGGFDAVIGNPPYIRIQTMDSEDISYFSSNFDTAIGNYDIYCLFVEKGIKIIKNSGRLGFILPHRFFKTEYGEGLRSFIVNHKNLEQVLDFDGYMVFDSASINTCILILAKSKTEIFSFTQVKFTQKNKEEMALILSDLKQYIAQNQDIISGEIPISNFSVEPWIFILKQEEKLWKKLNSVQQNLGDITTNIFQGLKTSADPIYIGELIKEYSDKVIFRSQVDKKDYEIESKLVKPLIKGGNMKRYLIADTYRIIIFPYENGNLISQELFKQDFPKAWKYLLLHKNYLEKRENNKFKTERWYEYGRSQALNIMHMPKIVTPDYYAHASFSLDLKGQYYFCGGGAGGYGIVLKQDFNPYFIVGLLNSKLLDWYLQKITIRAYQTAYMYVKKYIQQLPISKITNLNRSLYEQIIQKVQEIIKLKKELQNVHTEQEKTIFNRQIAMVQEQINHLVYKLYELTPEEIKIIETE